MQGGSKIREAYLIFQDFAEKYPMTGMVLNGKAVCCMHMGSFDEAETLLLEALNKVSLMTHLATKFELKLEKKTYDIYFFLFDSHKDATLACSTQGTQTLFLLL